MWKTWASGSGRRGRVMAGLVMPSMYMRAICLRRALSVSRCRSLTSRTAAWISSRRELRPM